MGSTWGKGGGRGYVGARVGTAGMQGLSGGRDTWGPD